MQETKTIDRTGILLFLIMTFGATIAVSIILWSRGVSLAEPSIEGQLAVAGAMFFPGISSLIARRLRGEGLEDAGLRWGPRGLYIQAYFVIIIIFIAAFGLTAALLVRPDISLSAFSQRYAVALPSRPGLVLLAVFIATITIAPILNSIPAFGEELGWRGYLLPRLQPLGESEALIISGLVWGLWHVPFVLLLGYHYPAHRAEGALLFTAIVILLGIYVGYLRLASGSTVLAAFAHGMFNSQFYGVWQLIFPNIDPILGGMTGLAGAAVLLPLAAMALKARSKSPSSSG
jgi:membrane protease YdiL (CAAX protease family)